MLFNSPLSPDKADRLIQTLSLSSNAPVLDAGCGTGEFLLRVVEATGAHGTGLDRDPEAVQTAQDTAAARVPQATCTFEVADLGTRSLPQHSFAAAICMGATHAFGSADSAFPNALDALSRAVYPGGLLLMGEGYWKQPPASEYLELLGDPTGIYHDHAGNIAFAEKRGLTTLYAAVSNEDEWDDFEWSHRMRLERLAADHPEDADLASRLERHRSWRDGYLRWGRTTMGFGFYLFQTTR